MCMSSVQRCMYMYTRLTVMQHLPLTTPTLMGGARHIQCLNYKKLDLLTLSSAHCCLVPYVIPTCYIGG